MNWIAFAAVAACFGPIASVAVGAFIYGKLTQSVVDIKENVKEKTAELSETVKGHGETLTEHGEAIAGLQARPRYVNGSGH